MVGDDPPVPAVAGGMAMSQRVCRLRTCLLAIAEVPGASWTSPAMALVDRGGFCMFFSGA